MAFLLTNLVQSVYSDLSQTEPSFGLFTATGGSATTFVNTAWGNLESPPETDVFKNYLAIVVRDAGGAGVSPEGKWGLCSAYVDSTYTGTIATVTDAIASGDTIMLAKQDTFPLQQVIFCINRALEDLGDLPANANTSLTTAANQTEYNIPVGVKRGLKQIWIQGQTGDSDDNQWIPVHDRRNELTGANSASILYIPQPSSGYTIRLIYDGPHAVVSAYSDVINEYVHPRVATLAAELKILEWYNNSGQGTNDYLIWLEEEIRSKRLPLALLDNPIIRPRRLPKYSIFDMATTPYNPELDGRNTG